MEIICLPCQFVTFAVYDKYSFHGRCHMFKIHGNSSATRTMMTGYNDSLIVDGSMDHLHMKISLWSYCYLLLIVLEAVMSNCWSVAVPCQWWVCVCVMFATTQYFLTAIWLVSLQYWWWSKPLEQFLCSPRLGFVVIATITSLSARLAVSRSIVLVQWASKNFVDAMSIKLEPFRVLSAQSCTRRTYNVRIYIYYT